MEIFLKIPVGNYWDFFIMVQKYVHKHFVTTVCGIAAYAALLVVVLPKGERAALGGMLARVAGRSAVETPN